jgi:hypothetical protein
MFLESSEDGALSGFENEEPKGAIAIRAYGVSGTTLKREIETITGVNPGKQAVYSEETGRISVTSEVFGDGCGGGGGDCYGCDGGGGGGEGAIICLIIVLAIMVALTVVWAVVMIAFSIMTLGGFFRKRYRTLVVFEKQNKEFIGKLAVISAQYHGVLQYSFGYPEYDDWAEDTFRLFNRLKYIRQASLFFGFWWAFVEVAFKLNELILGVGGYNLWPLRYVMIAIFVPMLLYSPILEIQFRRAFNTGEEMVMRLVNQEPSYSPNQPMMFSVTPYEVGKITPPKEKKG